MKFSINSLVLLFGLLLMVSAANAESSREQLNQLVEQLQKSPNDNALRENIIKLSQTIKPAPAIPEEARRAFVRGNTAFSEAKSPDDYARAIQRYEEALAIAPWWGDAYFNLAKALEMRQEYSRAIQTIKLFVLTGPSAEDVRKAQDYSYTLEDKADAATKRQVEKKESDVTERNEQRIVALQRNFPRLINKLEGTVFVGNYDDGGGTREIYFLRQPFDFGSKTYKSTSYLLWSQVKNINDKSIPYSLPGLVMPVSDNTFWLTSGFAPTDLDSPWNKDGAEDKVTLSQDGLILTNEYYVEGKHKVIYYTKKQ